MPPVTKVQENTGLPATASKSPSPEHLKRAVSLLLFIVASSGLGSAEPIPAHHKQGSMHGFLLVKSSQNKVIAVGDLVQVAQGTQVRSRLVFRFRDGSTDEESTVFSETDVLRLVSDHHVQKGPSFPTPINITINVPAAEVRWCETKAAQVRTIREHMDLPDDLVNGMFPLVLDNIAPNSAVIKTVSYLASTPKPRIVKLLLKSVGLERFTIGGLPYFANRYDIHVELGGLAGVMAPLTGKQPPDLHSWVMTGEVPGFAKMETPFYQGGPVWTVELASPEWVASPAGQR